MNDFTTPNRLWFVTPSLGKSSEVWMSRQLNGIRRLRTTVVAWESDTAKTRLEAQAAGVSLELLPMHFSLGGGRWGYRLRYLPYGSFYAAVGAERRTIQQLLRKRRPDVILCQYGPTALKVLPLATKHRVPVVLHFHGYDISRLLRDRWYRWSLSLSFSSLAAIIVVADYQREWLIRQGVPPDKVHLIPCGVPVHEFTPANDVSTQPCRFLSVGRFVEKKAPLVTIRAFAASARQTQGTILTMIGDGPLKNEAMKLAAELGLHDRILFLGAQPPGTVKDELSRSSAFVQHSVTSKDGDKEGWPVAIAEAAASGLPVIATRHAAIPEQVEDNSTGILVDEHDCQAMGAAMQRLALEPQTRRRMGEAARAKAALQFDLSTQLARLEQVLIGTAATSTS